jgi:hypothetical protein
MVLVLQEYYDGTGIWCIGEDFWLDQTIRIEKEYQHLKEL